MANNQVYGAQQHSGRRAGLDLLQQLHCQLREGCQALLRARRQVRAGHTFAQRSPFLGQRRSSRVGEL